MDCEKQTTEYKSLLKIRTGDKGFKDLSVTCVALANAQGGRIFIGYDDKKKAPLPEQHVTPDEVNEAVTKLRSLCFNVGLVASEWPGLSLPLVSYTLIPSWCVYYRPGNGLQEAK